MGELGSGAPGPGGAHGRARLRTVYFAAQLGKYVPGSVWPAVIQARLGKRSNVGATTMLASYAIWMGVLCAVGAVSGALVLTDPGVELSAWVVLAAVAVALAALPLFLHDRGLPALVTWAVRRSGRQIEGLRIRRDAGRLALLLSAGTWLAFGVHAWVLARPLGAGPDDLLLVIGAFALAFVAGVVIVPLPAGAGVREAILVLTLGVAIGRPGAITVALLSRLIMILAEFALAALTGVPGAIRWARTAGDADVGAVGGSTAGAVLSQALGAEEVLGLGEDPAVRGEQVGDEPEGPDLHGEENEHGGADQARHS